MESPQSPATRSDSETASAPDRSNEEFRVATASAPDRSTGDAKTGVGSASEQPDASAASQQHSQRAAGQRAQRGIKQSDVAYQEIRRLIVELELRLGEQIREDELQESLGIGRTPVREALQRLAREQLVTVVPRRGMFVAGIDPGELSLLFETRAVLEPYAARLAAERGSDEHWATMAEILGGAAAAEATAMDLLEIDRRCHELVWEAAGNRFLTDSLDMLYAQSDRVWHMYLAGVTDMGHAVAEHHDLLRALRGRDADAAAALAERHVRAFDAQIRAVAPSERFVSQDPGQ